MSLFLNNLRSGATECQFKNSLEERLHDQFLFGLSGPKMQEELIRLQTLKIYHDKIFELSYEEGILLWQERIVIPSYLRRNILEFYT